MENHNPPSACPNYTEDGEEIEVEVPKSVQKPPGAVPKVNQEEVAVHDGEGLTAGTANAAASNLPTKIVLFAGEANSGKTTLIAETFNYLQRGRFPSGLFAGSYTMMGFERRCHLARIESGEPNADTARTKLTDEDVFLSLVFQDTGHRIVQVLLADFAGELFRRAITDSGEARKIPHIHRADIISLLLDGEMLASGSGRVAAVTHAKRLLQRLIQDNLLATNAKVQIIFTKWDLVEAADKTLRAIDYVDQTESVMAEQFGGHVSVSFHRVAARRRQPLGLESLVASWIEDTDNAGAETIPEVVPTRMMGRFSLGATL